MNSQSAKGTLTSLEKAEFLGTSIRTHMPTVSPKLAEAYGGGTAPPGPVEVSNTDGWDQIQESNVQLVEKEAMRSASSSESSCRPRGLEEEPPTTDGPPSTVGPPATDEPPSDP